MADNALLRLANMYRDARAEADKAPDSMTSQVSRLAMAGSPEEHAYYEVIGGLGDNMDHSGLQEMMGGRQPQPQRQSQRDPMPTTPQEARQFIDKMKSEFKTLYGRNSEEFEEEAKAAAPGTDFSTAEGRQEFYGRIARMAGLGDQDQDDGRTSMAGGNRSGGHAPMQTGGRDENEDWLRATTEWQTKAGLK